MHRLITFLKISSIVLFCRLSLSFLATCTYIIYIYIIASKCSTFSTFFINLHVIHTIATNNTILINEFVCICTAFFCAIRVKILDSKEAENLSRTKHFFGHFAIEIPIEKSLVGEGLPDELGQKQNLFWASLDQWNGIRLGIH